MWLSSTILFIPHINHHHHISVMELGHLLTRSGSVHIYFLYKSEVYNCVEKVTLLILKHHTLVTFSHRQTKQQIIKSDATLIRSNIN